MIRAKTAIVIVGPTGSGKSTLGWHIARMCEGEIVSADSRQLYKGMDIGTAKPSLSERETVPHHGLDLQNPSMRVSAGEYARIARGMVEDIFSRGRIPVIVGGSGLYIRALVDGFFPEDIKNPEIRLGLKEIVRDKGLPFLYDRLVSVDPESAGRIHPNDQKRILRALEVWETSGTTISCIQREKTEAPSFSSRFWGLAWRREDLYSRVHERITAMIQAGWLDEVKQLKTSGMHPDAAGWESLGYREFSEFLDGKVGWEETVEMIKQNTRRFAKRQLIWFRRDRRISWIPVEESVDWPKIAGQIVRSYETGDASGICDESMIPGK